MFSKLIVSIISTLLIVSTGPTMAADRDEDKVERRPVMQIEWSKLRNPVMDREPEVSVRDPLLHYHEGVFRCFYSAVEEENGNFQFSLEMVESTDLLNWSRPKRLTDSKLGFSSPGNIIKLGSEWIMSVQTYPVKQGEKMASEDARLWYMKSSNLEDWDEPVCIKPQGAEVDWSASKRQIDPCFIKHDGKYWSLYKTDGRLGLLVSRDFRIWKEASPLRPVLDRSETPDNSSVENPFVMKEGDEYVLIFSPCRKGRGIGLAKSKDLLHWHDIHYLSLPELTWADNGPSAAQIADLRDICGKYIMVFHGERRKIDAHAAAIGIAFSDDLEHWTVPK